MRYLQEDQKECKDIQTRIEAERAWAVALAVGLSFGKVVGVDR